MINENYLKVSSKLYEKIFGEKVDNSVEFTTFVQGNPHPLRMKIEEEIVIINDELMITTNARYANKLVNRRNDLKELERMVMEFIENNT